MKNKVNFDTSNQSFGGVIGNSKIYIVPKYQRDYSWEQEQWEDLWQDILDIHDQNPAAREEHYMGYLVLQKQDINEFKIIDGQQRLTTLSLLILAALQILKISDDEQDKERFALLKSNYISTRSASTLAEIYKLTLNRNNNEYYRHDLAALTTDPRKRNIKRTEHQMRKAKEFYEQKIKELKLDSQELGDFIENIISNYLLFTVITVGDDVNAYKVFETLNARGVYLSTPDLLKNYLFSVIDPEYNDKQLIEQEEDKWSITLDNLGKEDFSKFLRCFWNSRNKLVSKTNLFKKIKATCTTREEAMEILDNLKETSSIYAALTRDDDEQWQYISAEKDKNDIKNCLLALRVFNIVQPYPILLSAWFSYENKYFARICKWIHAFCIRYHAICNFPAKDIERFYNQLAIDIYQNTTVTEIKRELQSKMPYDERFKQDFSNKTLAISQSTGKAYYLLASIENYLNPRNKIPLRGSYSIEHILPKNPADDGYWRSQFSDQLEQYISRLGNLVLLSEEDNKKANQLTFADKKHIYNESTLALAKELCKYEDWNTDSLNEYQRFMAAQAVQIWKID